MNLTEPSEISLFKKGAISKIPLRPTHLRRKHKIKLEGNYGESSIIHMETVKNTVSNSKIRGTPGKSTGNRFSSSKRISPSPVVYTPSRDSSITASLMGSSTKNSLTNYRVLHQSYDHRKDCSYLSIKLKEDSIRSPIHRQSPNVQNRNRVKNIRSMRPFVGEYRGTKQLRDNSFSVCRYLNATSAGRTLNDSLNKI